MENKEIRQDDLMNIIVKIPKDAASMQLNVIMVSDHGDIEQVSGYFNTESIREARQAFLDNVEDGDDYDAVYVLTDKGREYLRQLEQQED